MPIMETCMPIQEPGQMDLGRIAELMKSLRSGNEEAAGQLVARSTPSYAACEASGRRTRGSPPSW
jgi:hypothetical protein